MKASEAREMDLEALAKLEIELQREHFDNRLQKGTGQMTKNHVFRKVRKDIARVKTIITEKKMAQQQANGVSKG
jgi:large subunit ribosomal protein L29